MAGEKKRRARAVAYGTYGTAAYAPGYDGTAARPLPREAPPQPRPKARPRPRERAIARPQVQVRERGRVSLFAVAGFLAVGLLSALLVLSYVNLTVLHSDTVSLRNELAALQGEESVLMAKYELAYDLKTIGETVTASGQMVKPVEGQIYVLDLSEPDSVVYYEKESALEGVAGMLRGGREIFDAMLEYFR